MFSIACYKCASINGSNPLCEDFFQGDRQTDQSSSLLQSPCLTHLRGRQGLFPATHCIKLLAYPAGSRSGQYIYRTCARDEDDDNNGITRTSHCGFVKLDWIDPHRRFRGCLHVCDKDACNLTLSIFANRHGKRAILLQSLLFIIVIHRRIFLAK